MLDPCLTPALLAEAPSPGRRAILGSAAGISGMELGGLEPPTSWVRFAPGGAPRHSAVFRLALRANFWDPEQAAEGGRVPAPLDSCLVPPADRGYQPADSSRPS